MKKLLIGLIAVTSTSAFADEAYTQPNKPVVVYACKELTTGYVSFMTKVIFENGTIVETPAYESISRRDCFVLLKASLSDEGTSVKINNNNTGTSNPSKKTNH